MKNNFALCFLISVMVITLSGCVPLIIGAAAGGMGAYAVSKDTIQGETDKPYDLLWDAALRVSKIKGAIKEADVDKGYIEMEADSSRVGIKLIRLTHATTRLRIWARKYHFPNLDLAQDMYVKILEEAK